MNSLKKASGTFKGLAGECMFRISKRETILTHFQPKEQSLRLVENIYTKEQLDFLNQHWHTIDAIDTKEAKIYEIKTKSTNYGKYQLRIMAHCHNVLKKASKIGIKTILAKVILEEDWLYLIEESDYNNENLNIIIPKKYNKPYETISHK